MRCVSGKVKILLFHMERNKWRHGLPRRGESQCERTLTPSLSANIDAMLPLHTWITVKFGGTVKGLSLVLWPILWYPRKVLATSSLSANINATLPLACLDNSEFNGEKGCQTYCFAWKNSVFFFCTVLIFNSTQNVPFLG